MAARVASRSGKTTAGFPPTTPLRMQVAKANGWFFREICDATLAISPECERQVTRVAGTTKGICSVAMSASRA